MDLRPNLPRGIYPYPQTELGDKRLNKIARGLLHSGSLSPEEVWLFAS